MLSYLDQWYHSHTFHKYIFQYVDLLFTWETNNQELFQIAAQMFKPQCQEVPDEGQESLVSFKMINNAKAYMHLKEWVASRTPIDGQVLTYCSKEKGTMRMNRYLGDEMLLFATTKTDSFFVTDLKFQEIYFVTHPDYLQKPTFKKDGFMFWEHILHKLFNSQGSILVHGSAVAGPEGVILFTGPKRSGKTTLFFEACKKLGLIPVSVDKVHLRIEDGRVMVYGFPTRLRALAGTLSKYKELQEYIPVHYQDASTEELWKGSSDGKVDISIEEFEKFCGQSFQSSGKLSLIVFPELNQLNETATWAENTWEKTLEQLQPNLYTPDNPEEDWWSPIGVGQETEMKVARDQILQLLRENIPAVSLSAGSTVDGPLSEIYNQFFKSKD